MSIPTRLLDTWTGEFVIKIDRPRYAILSHVWNVEGEQSYSSTREIQRSVHQQSQMDQLDERAPLPHHHAEQNSCLDHPRMSEKIRRACAVARAHGYRYIWVDSCCIDKTSSAELSEAINSMFAWYRDASVCYAFLADVRSNQNPRAHRSDFRQTRWFTRGWTLQELVAPEAIVFLSQDWQVIGTKSSLASLISLITTIPTSVLLCTVPLRDFSVARRMSWASNRRTTRVEDEAYSLLGIFDINMSTLYGEGRRAFTRLQEEILKRIPDQTLLAWGPRVPWGKLLQDSPSFHVGDSGNSPCFATSVVDFASCREDVNPISDRVLASALDLQARLPLQLYTTTSYGVHVRLPLLPCEYLLTSEYAPSSMHFYLAILACGLSDGSLLAAICYTNDICSEEGSSALTLHGGLVLCGRRGDHVVVLSQGELRTIRGRVRLMDAYLDPGYFQSTSQRLRARTSKDERIHLAPWSREPLSARGYTVALQRVSTYCAHSLILHNGEEYINIDIRHLDMPAHVRWLDDESAISQVDTRHLRKLATVKVPGFRDNMSGTSTGRSEFVRSSGVADICTVTVTYSSEVSLWSLDITFAPGHASTHNW